ncbi:MAG: polymer-forming cytoskeletal protein [Rhodospirillales bacterium]|nr:polymer-forming cytoskeletal protein [Rhodospirillales bacterium]
MTEQDNTAREQESSASVAMGGYQRPGQAPVRSAGGYPGAYPGFGGSSDTASDSERRLTIGRGITMSGEIESCDYLLVEGTVEAALKGANVLEIAESGIFYGTVEINDANIAGRFEGDITVSGRLTIAATGTVTGSISYKEIAIEAGAVIDGKLTPLSAIPAAEKKPAPAKAVKPAAPRPERVEKQPEPANTDEGLFSKAAAAAE